MITDCTNCHYLTSGAVEPCNVCKRAHPDNGTDYYKSEADYQLMQSKLKLGIAKADAVNHPTHYCKGGIECINAIKASMSAEAFKGHCKGNIIKYVYRYEDKGGAEDLKKAKVYLDWLIGACEE